MISSQVTEAMLGRRRHLNTDQAERDLREQLKKLHDQLAETKRELHLDPDSIHSVVEAGLALAGQAPLGNVKVDGIWPDLAGIDPEAMVSEMASNVRSSAIAAAGTSIRQRPQSYRDLTLIRIAKPAELASSFRQDSTRCGGTVRP